MKARGGDGERGRWGEEEMGRGGGRRGGEGGGERVECVLGKTDEVMIEALLLLTYRSPLPV